MTALKSKRALLGLAALAAVAAILASGLLRGDEPPAGNDVATVTSVAGTGSSTDRLIAGFQRRLKDNPEDFSSYINLANAYLQKVRETGGTVAQAHLRMGKADIEIVELAKEIDAGLLILGSRGLGRIERALIGSVSDSVVRHAHCPVTVVRQEKE